MSANILNSSHRAGAEVRLTATPCKVSIRRFKSGPALFTGGLPERSIGTDLKSVGLCTQAREFESPTLRIMTIGQGNLALSRQELKAF